MKIQPEKSKCCDTCECNAKDCRKAPHCTFKECSCHSTPEQPRELEHTAVNIVYQIGDNLHDHITDGNFEMVRQNTNDENINFVLKLLSQQISKTREETIKECVGIVENEAVNLVKGQFPSPYYIERCVDFANHLLKKANHADHEIGAKVIVLSEIINKLNSLK